MDDRKKDKELELELRRLGVSEDETELLELMPLVEMVWADGHAADAELCLLDAYIEELAAGVDAPGQQGGIDVSRAESFVLPFLQQRPRRELLQTLRNIGLQLLLQRPDAPVRKQRLLAACLDIGSAAVKQYPYPMGERFSSEEKQTFFEILRSIEEPERDRLSTM